jgi:hypothetical protein
VGKHIVQRLIGLEALAGLAVSIQPVKRTAARGEAPCRMTGPNNNTVGEPDGTYGEDQ